MEKNELITELSKKLRLIRAEIDFSQDEMAVMLGISKKTLVQIEKGRTVASWIVIVTVIALFDQSENLQNVLGNEPLEVIRLIAFEKIDQTHDQTMGGKVWWRDLTNQGLFKIQENVISQQYRIIDERNFRWFSSFNKEDVMNRFEELKK